jgi:hypothetical protein
LIRNLSAGRFSLTKLYRFNPSASDCSCGLNRLNLSLESLSDSFLANEDPPPATIFLDFDLKQGKQRRSINVFHARHLATLPCERYGLLGDSLVFWGARTASHLRLVPLDFLDRHSVSSSLASRQGNRPDRSIPYQFAN